jgi:hypothetical protein
MSEDASLDDFLNDSDDGTAESASADGTPSDADTASADPESEAAETPSPATTTYAWDGDGAACESCGETVEKRWQQDGGLVCVECKEWSE